MPTENEMSDEELENEEAKTTVTEDTWDRLELLRRKLNESHLEKMYVIKRSQKLGSACPYYKKAKRLFIHEQAREIQQLLYSLSLDTLVELEFNG